jgi:hypothetical protein
MRHMSVAIAVAFAPLASRGAGTGPELSIRSGYAVPFGDLLGSADVRGGALPVREMASGNFPLQADVGYRFSPNVYAGLYGSYSVVLANNCASAAGCAAHGWRLGANAQIHPMGDAPVDPWVGIGAGYEWLSLAENTADSTRPFDVDGIEFVNLQVGIDFEMSPAFKLGPVAAFSVGQYWRYTERATPGVVVNESSVAIDDKRLHEWIVVGLRATFRP